MLKKWLKEYIEINQKEILYVISFLILGIILGILIYIFVPIDVKDASKESVANIFNISRDEAYVKTNIILNGIKINIIIIITMAIFSIMLFGKWGIYGIVTLKAISLSLYTIILFNIFGPLYGILVVLLLVILVNIIYIPALIYVSINFLEINFNIFNIKQNINNVLVSSKTFFRIVIALLLMLSSTIVEQIASTIVLKIYCNL